MIPVVLLSVQDWVVVAISQIDLKILHSPSHLFYISRKFIEANFDEIVSDRGTER